MDAQHEKHRNFLKAFECDVVACPYLQFYLRFSIWKYNPKLPPSFPLHASQLAERQGRGTANDLAADEICFRLRRRASQEAFQEGRVDSRTGLGVMTVFSVHHTTTYRYRNPVTPGRHQMLFRPRDSFDQRLLDSRLAVTPDPVEICWIYDVFGNCVTLIDFADAQDF